LSLVTTLGATNPQYVRCVKPNSIKKSFHFEEELVLAQLRYSGMLETIRIRKAGYSVRVPFDQFMEKFKMLLPKVEGSSPRDQVDYLLKKLQIDAKHWQLGKTKIFMRNTVVCFPFSFVPFSFSFFIFSLWPCSCFLFLLGHAHVSFFFFPSSNPFKMPRKSS
jgi:hypothetical protein